MDGKTTALLIFCWGLFSCSLIAQDRQERIERAAGYHSLGIYYSYEIWDSTFYFSQLAAREREKLFADSPNLDLGKSNYNAGYFLRFRSHYAKARPYLERALAVYSNIQLPPDEAYRLPTSHLELARVFAGLGDYEKAKDQLRLVTAIINSATEAEMINLDDQYPASLSEWSGILMEQDSLNEAVSLARKAIEIYDGLIKQGQDYTYESLAPRTNLAGAMIKQGNYTAAETEYKIVIAGYSNYEDEDYNLALNQNNLADMLIRMGRLKEARQTLNAAQKAALASGDLPLMAQYEDHMGSLLEAEGKPRQAARAFQAAQALLLPEYAPEDITEAPPLAQLKYTSNGADLFLYINDQARTLGAMAVKEARFYEGQLGLYRTGDALLDGLRNNHDGEATKLFWRQKALPFYEAAIRACHRAGRAEDAFYFFEKSKAILLFEALADNDALRQLPDSLQAREAELATALTNAKTDLSNAKDQSLGLQAIVDAQSALESFRNGLRQDFPRYRALTETINVPDPAVFYRDKLAPNGQTLVHYFFGPERTYALTLDVEGIATFDLGPSDSIRAATTALLAYFKSSAEIPNNPAGYAAAASAAYNALILPLHLRPRHQLVIVPDGPLTYLPFPALLTEATNGNRLGDLPYMIRQHPISYGHSASILNRDRTPTSDGVSITAFAPFTDGSALLDYPTLPFSQDELSTVSADFQTQLFKDTAATLSAFRTATASGEILHLSTHAFSSTETQSPLIAFHDQPLYLRDLYHENLSADLVVLSACQTNVGKLAGGEGVLGLGRGFIQAGAGSIIASLWNVNARGSGRVLGDFYQQLNAGKSKGMALHEAQLYYLNDDTLRDLDKSPYLWAGLTYYGNERILTLQRKTGAWLWWGLGIVGTLMAVMAFLLRRKRS